jgi:hypothetical protein
MNLILPVRLQHVHGTKALQAKCSISNNDPQRTAPLLSSPVQKSLGVTLQESTQANAIRRKSPVNTPSAAIPQSVQGTRNDRRQEHH